MNEFELKKAFGVIISRSDLDKNKLPVAELFYENGVDISKRDILSVVNKLGFKSIKDYKENSIGLIMHYIYNALNDNKLSKAEKANIKFLKIALEVNERDFVKNKDIKDNEIRKRYKKFL